MWIVPYFLTETLRLRLFSLLTHLLSYQALKCFVKFAIHSEGISFEAEPFTSWYRAEVRAVRAVVPTGNGNKLAAENLRVALAECRRQRLFAKREMFLTAEFLADLVATEHAQIALARLHAGVVAKNGFQVHADVRVAVPTFFIVLIHSL